MAAQQLQRLRAGVCWHGDRLLSSRLARQTLGLKVQEHNMTTPLHLTGTLKTNAQVRTHLDPRSLRETPALRIELEHVKGTAAYSITLTIPCTSYSDAEARSKTLLKGRVIDFEATAEDAHVLFPTVREINIH
jgi:hypothetical protein